MLGNPKKMWSNQICHSYLQKFHSATKNYKNVTLPPKITKMPQRTENAGPMTWTD